MNSTLRSTRFALLLFSLLLPFAARAAEYQWGYVMPEEPATSQLWGKSPFFLYIPRNVTKVRGVLMAPANIIERGLADDAAFRAEAGRDGFAILLAGGAFNAVTGAGETIQTINGAASLASTGLEAAEFASGVGEVKLANDFLTWAGSLAGCAAGIIHK